MLNIEIRLVNYDDEGTEEIIAPSIAANQEEARKLAQEQAEAEKSIVRLFVVGGDDHFHEPIEVDDFYPVKHWVDQMIEALPETVELTYVDYRDQLSDDQITHALAGEMDKVWDSMDEWRMDSESYGINYLFDDCVPDEAKGHEDEIRSSDEYERFQQECWDRDRSDPFDDLARNTPGVMIRYNLDYEVPPDSWSMSGEEIEKEAKCIAEAAGIEYSGNRKELIALVMEASYGGSLCVLHCTDITDAMKVVNGGTVVFTDPQLLVYDGFNGSGHMEEVTGTITVTIDDDHPMRHDTGSYSWSDGIAGIVHSCAETPAEFKAKDAAASS